MTDLIDLPKLTSEYPVTPAQRAQFARDGHIVLPAVMSREEAAAYRPHLTEAVRRFNTETRPLSERDTYGRAFLQVMNLWVQSEAVRRYTLARRFAQIAADLLGVPGVRIYHDQALYKEPGGGHTPWHQDQYYWPLDTNNTLTLWMPLIDITEEMGSLIFASGSGSEGYLGKLPISDESDELFNRFIAERGYTRTSNGDMRAGDASFHNGWVIHSAPGNAGTVTREVMTVIYFADGARVIEPDNKNRVRDLASWLPGLRPGDLAASEINPLVYTQGA